MAVEGWICWSEGDEEKTTNTESIRANKKETESPMDSTDRGISGPSFGMTKTKPKAIK
jgi:hypothetical protein